MIEHNPSTGNLNKIYDFCKHNSEDELEEE